MESNVNGDTLEVMKVIGTNHSEVMSAINNLNSEFSEFKGKTENAALEARLAEKSGGKFIVPSSYSPMNATGRNEQRTVRFYF